MKNKSIKQFQSDRIYLICPDKKCNRFYSSKEYSNFCIYKCAHKSKLVKLIVCIGCNELIKIPKKISIFQRIEHNCENGKTALNYQHSKYELLYKIPKEIKV